MKDESGRGTGRLLSAIDRLYGRFDAMYMQKWRSHFTSPEVIEDWKKTWSSALISNGVTFQMAFEGIERCSREYPKWPPSEGEFIGLCKPPLDYEQAFLDAVRQMHKRHGDGKDFWPVAAIYWAAVDFGQYELRNTGYRDAAAKWKRLLDKRMQGVCPEVPVFAFQLTAPPINVDGVAITSAEAKAEAMRAMANLAFKKPSRTIALQRAQAVLAKHAAGEYIAPFQLTHAREVLNRLAPDPADDEGNIHLTGVTA